MILHPTQNIRISLSNVSGDFELDRNELRKIAIDRLLKEKPGTGKGELTSKYRYNVEELGSGNIVYITRPVPLNKGFDFIIHVEGMTFLNGKDNPKHEDIYNDLGVKKGKYPEEFAKLFLMIDKVYHCYDPEEVLSSFQSVNFGDGFTSELTLKVIKWFFLEQDIRYWNWSGRHMFMSGINSLTM